MPVLPVAIRGDANVQLEGIAATLRSMPERVQPSIVPLLCAQIPTKRAYEELVHVSAVPKARKWIEERAGGVIATLKQTIANDTYEVSVEINGDDWDDDRIGAYGPLVQEMMQSLLLAPDELVTTNLIVNGTSGLSYDGVAFYAATHKWPNGEFSTAQLNLQSQTGTAADQIENDFYVALAAMSNWKDDRGRLRIPPADLFGDGALAVHFPAGNATLAQAMNRVFGITKGGDAFDLVVTSGSGATKKSALSGRAQLIPDGYLSSSSNAWYLHSIKGSLPSSKPFAFLDREPAHVTILSKGTEHYEKNNSVMILGKRRFGMGYLKPERSQKVA